MEFVIGGHGGVYADKLARVYVQQFGIGETTQRSEYNLTAHGTPMFSMVIIWLGCRTPSSMPPFTISSGNEKFSFQNVDFGG
jgi:hypothetical protein